MQTFRSRKCSRRKNVQQCLKYVTCKTLKKKSTYVAEWRELIWQASVLPQTYKDLDVRKCNKKLLLPSCNVVENSALIEITLFIFKTKYQKSGYIYNCYLLQQIMNVLLEFYQNFQCSVFDFYLCDCHSKLWYEFIIKFGICLLSRRPFTVIKIYRQTL